MIGCLLVVVWEAGVHSFKEGANEKETQENAEKIAGLDHAISTAFDATRPWDVAGNYYHRFSGSRYSLTVFSWSEPFNWTQTKRRTAAADYLGQLKRDHQSDGKPHDPDYDLEKYSMFGGDHELTEFPLRRVVEFFVGIPDGVIYVSRKVARGGWPNIVLNLMAALLALAVLGAFEAKFSFWNVVLFPVYTSLAATVLWCGIYVATHLFSFLAVPSVSFLLAVFPGIASGSIAAVHHIPMLVSHKVIEEEVESRLTKDSDQTGPAATVQPPAAEQPRATGEKSSADDPS